MIQKRFVYEHIMTEVALEIVYVENNGLFNRWCYDNTLSNGAGGLSPHIIHKKQFQGY